MKEKRVWVGFCDGRPYTEMLDAYYDKTPFLAVFKNRKAARKCFEDVREFILKPVTAPKGRKK